MFTNRDGELSNQGFNISFSRILLDAECKCCNLIGWAIAQWSAISVQWLAVVDKIELFSCFCELLKAHLQRNGQNIWKDSKEGINGFLN